MKNLFLIVYEQDDINSECDWFFKVSEKKYLSTEDERELIAEWMIDSDMAEDTEEALKMLSNHWSQKITEVEGYKVSIKKIG